ncbi:MAG: glutamate-1-semialdehyde 2,1-aminomutase, partial [Thermoproteus sp.]|nr:glutamate-1-semialdehyde 2,1-aminomutase [Thermoproteus sp.]
PLVAERAEGAYIYTDRGPLIDLCMGFGPLILGHRPQPVLEAVRAWLEKGWLYALLTEPEIELGELIVRHVPSVKMVRFVASGSEATMNAIRLARAYTRRDVVVKFEGNYHGAHDYVLVKAGSGAATWGVPTSAGIPQEVAKLTAVVPYNDAEAFRAAMREVGPRLAAVIVEPVAANYGLIVPDPDFLKALREETESMGAMLVFDEVVTGFRLGLSGAQGYFGVLPDITTLGKIITGGFPGGAFGSRRDVMELVAPSGPVYNAGTFNAHPISMVAGVATIRELEKGYPYQIADDAAKRLAEGIEEVASRLGFDVVVKRIASMFQLYFKKGDVKRPQDVRASDEKTYLRLHALALKHGVYLTPSQFEVNFTSAAHTKEVVEEVLTALEKAFRELKSSG